MSYKLLFLLIFSLVFLSGCICPPCDTRPAPPPRPTPADPAATVPPPSSATPAPRTTVPVPRPDSRPRYHTVEAGENLYRIGLRYDLRPEELMAFNGLADTRISVGQVLQLFPGERTATPTPRAPAPRTTTPSAPPPVTRAPAPSSGTSVSSVSRISSDQLALVRSAEGINWRWPTSGNVVGTFRSDDVSRQGIAIAGSKGQQVLAAADGVVTYQGEALASYGKLLIVKHNDQFLTAYAHNDSFLVKEGDKVRAGQPIATMGSSGAERVQLGFEVRKGGNPVDPLRYMPEL